MIADLNTYSTKLITLLEKKEERDGDNKDSENFTKLKGTPQIIDLGKVKNLKSHNSDEYGNKVSAYAHLDDGVIGLSNKNYVLLQELVTQILDIHSISENADSKFLEHEVFEWLIECYSRKKVEQNLFDYLSERIKAECHEYVFYFKIIALAIEDSFTIGNIEIIHLEDKRLLKTINSFGKKESKIIGSFKEEFENSIIAVSKSFGVQSKAQKIAMKNVEIAINALKIPFLQESVDLSYQIFDVDYRMNSLHFSNFLVMENEDPNSLSKVLKRNQGAHPIILNNERLALIEKNGLKIISEFISKKVKNELQGEIVDGIEQFGKIISNRNFYQRIVELISFFERFIVPKNSNKAYGQTRLKSDVIPRMRISSSKKDQYRKLVNKFYEIRDKFLHNKIELPINLYELYYFQEFGYLFLLKIIRASVNYKNIAELQLFFGIKDSNNDK